jgi:hypothetical protein
MVTIERIRDQNDVEYGIVCLKFSMSMYGSRFVYVKYDSWAWIESPPPEVKAV